MKILLHPKLDSWGLVFVVFGVAVIQMVIFLPVTFHLGAATCSFDVLVKFIVDLQRGTTKIRFKSTTGCSPLVKVGASEVAPWAWHIFFHNPVAPLVEVRMTLLVNLEPEFPFPWPVLEIATLMIASYILSVNGQYN